MSIRKFVSTLNIIIVLSTIVTGAALILLLQKSRQLEAAHEQRFLSNLLVAELRGSSETLTSQVRVYAATGSGAAEAAYNKVLTVRSGQDPRPMNALIAPGEMHVLLDLMKAHGVTDAEFEKVTLANQLSDALVLLEVEAMNAVKGNFKDAQGNYTVKGQPNLELATRLVFGQDYIGETVKIMAPLEEFSRMVNERTGREAEALGKQQQLMAVVVSAALFVVFISCAFNFMAMRRKVILPLEQTTHFAGRVAAGELEASIADGGNDEMAQLRRTLNSMVSNLKSRLEEVQRSSEQAAAKEREALQAKEEGDLALEQARREGERRLELAGRLQELADSLSTAASQLEEQIRTADRGAEEQSGQATETATAMEEMNASVYEVAKNAESAATVSDSAKAKAASGAAIVDNVVKSINSVHDNSTQLRGNMQTLEEQAEGINKIMTVISDIADQTNLLALNAAIEAARAGEAGRGFAVVADEVRKLAEKTMSSTADVGQAIKAIQESAATSVQRVESTAQLIEETTRLAQESGSTLKEIVELVAEAAQQITAINTASSEQTKVSDGITQAVGRISEISGDTMRTMHEASEAVENLAQQAGSMLELVENLRD